MALYGSLWLLIVILLQMGYGDFWWLLMAFGGSLCLHKPTVGFMAPNGLWLFLLASNGCLCFSMATDSSHGFMWLQMDSDGFQYFFMILWLLMASDGFWNLQLVINGFLLLLMAFDGSLSSCGSWWLSVATNIFVQLPLAPLLLYSSRWVMVTFDGLWWLMMAPYASI